MLQNQENPESPPQSFNRIIYNCKIAYHHPIFDHINDDQNEEEDAQSVYFDIKILLFNWNSRKSILLLFNDVSSQYRENQIKQLEDYKCKVLESISHNLKTPLHCIQLYLDLMRQDQSCKNNSSLTPIETATNILKSQIDQILDFSIV